MSRPPLLLLRSVALALALVIGNAACAAAPLANPGNDARAMRAALQGMGFSVIEARDASKAQMQAAITRAGMALKGRRGIGMLNYAGHGLQLDWRNYRVPVDARISSAAEVPAQTVDVQAVIDAFKAAGNRINSVVLDACRDNPFAATASSKGLAQMDAPPGTLLAYATAPGNVAEDGDAKSANGLYAQFLVKELAQPATKIEDVFKRVRLRVRIAESMRAADFSDYLLQFPNGHYAELAQFKLDPLATPQLLAAPDRSGRVAPAPGTLRYRVGDVYTYNFCENFGARNLPSSRVVWVDAQALFVVKNESKFSARKGTVANLGIELSDLKRMPR